MFSLLYNSWLRVVNSREEVRERGEKIRWTWRLKLKNDKFILSFLWWKINAERCRALTTFYGIWGDSA